MIQAKEMTKNISTYVDSILYIYSLANDQERKQGFTWYENTHNEARQIAENYSVPLERVIGVIAAISPRLPWSRTIDYTIGLIDQGFGFTMSAFHRNKIKAWKILTGSLDPSSLGNGKTWAFYSNILKPGSVTRVTIDVHAVRIAIGSLVGYDFNPDQAYAYCNTPKKYKIIETSYILASDRVNMLPHRLQAITWLTYRRLFVKDI